MAAEVIQTGGGDPCPALIAVDDDPDTLELIASEMRRRYGEDYHVVCLRSPLDALAVLEELRNAGREVAVILADQWMPEMEGLEFLDRARSLDPRAKRGLLIDWGGWGHRPTAQAIFTGMTATHMDYYVVKPWGPRDEQFHRMVTEFLHEWTRGRSPRASEITLVADEQSPRCYELRSVLGRNGVPFVFQSSASPEGRRTLSEVGHGGETAPVAVIRSGQVIIDPSSAQLAAAFGVDTELDARRDFDLVVVGAGPAGLTAAVYASSEGLRTLVVERGTLGGQAGSSSLIRNYLGFSRGISGAELAQRAYQQAWVFRTQFLLMRELTRVSHENGRFSLTVTGAGTVVAPAVVLATGMSYRRIAVPALEELIGNGVYYGASTPEAQALAGKEAYVVGGGNSAGQTVLHLACFAQRVTLLVRGPALGDTMSQYLRDALDAMGNVRVRLRTEVVDGGARDGRLDHLVLRDKATGETERVDADGLFILIGARPHTDWLPDGVERDRWGYVLTGSELVQEGRISESWPLERPPLMMETSLPGMFAVGDVRHGSTKRVASAVGDGAVVVEQIHRLFEPSEEAGEQVAAPAGRAG
jgi:thioredoxin reductase (NADPH)